MKKILFIFIALAALCLTSCGGKDKEKDEPKSSYSDIQLSCGDTHIIKGNADWTSSNEFIASVEGQTVTAERVGAATLSSSKGSFKVTVLPTVSVYKEPCIKWGASKKDVKSFMKGVTPDEEDDESITYRGSGALMLTMYFFEQGKLNGSGLALDGEYISSEALVDQMLEYYVPVSVDDDNYSFYFRTPDAKTIVALTLKASGRDILYVIVYAPASSKSRAESGKLDASLNAMGLTGGDVPAAEFGKVKSLLF